MSLRIDSQPVGPKRHCLRMHYNGQYIGEYERSQAADIERKKKEIKCSLSVLLGIYNERGVFRV